MGNAYREAMSYVAVTEEMRARILRNIRKADLSGRRKAHAPRPLPYVAAACLALLIAGAALLPRLSPPAREENPPGVQIGTGEIREAASLQELSQLVGFAVEPLTDLPFTLSETQYTAYGDKLAQVIYSGETERLTFRKAAGTEDPSGDYTVYSDTSTVPFQDLSVTLKGESGRYFLAVWQEGGYAYSLKSSSALSPEEWENIIVSAFC